MGTERSAVDSSAARTEILRRIREANGRPADAAARARQQWSEIERDYRRSATRPHAEVIELLEDRLRDYDAQVVHAAAGNVAATVAKMLIDRGLRRIVVPDGLDSGWIPEGFDFVIDKGFQASELDGFEGVMTGATLAIAETGSVVLQNAPGGQGRRAISLIPDYHLCIVRAQDVVETVPEALERLAATSGLPTTFFSGPSATADIEMTRIKGVHGPRFLDVALVS